MTWLVKTNNSDVKILQSPDEKHAYLIGLSVELHHIIVLNQKLVEYILPLFTNLNTLWTWLTTANKNYSNLNPLQYMKSEKQILEVAATLKKKK